MGFKISWLAFAEKSKDDILSSMHLVDTGESDEANESPISVANFPEGWIVLFLNEFSHPFVEDASLIALSSNCTVIAGLAHEGIMFSSSSLYRNGKLCWSVSHDFQQGPHDIQTEGTLPAIFEETRDRLIAKQKADDIKGLNVDYFFNVPVDLAKEVCGFEYCRWRYDWGQPTFTRATKRTLPQ